MTGIYARQSVEKKDSISVETQIRMCRERCPDDEVTVYTDRGFSGKNLKRPGYLRMMRDLADGKIRRVIVYRLDRLSRSVSDFSAMWELFERHNVEFSSISEQFDTSTPIGKAMVYIIMNFCPAGKRDHRRAHHRQLLCPGTFRRLARRPGALRLSVRQNPLRRTQYSHAYTRSKCIRRRKDILRLRQHRQKPVRYRAGTDRRGMRFRRPSRRLGQQIRFPHSPLSRLRSCGPRGPLLLRDRGYRHRCQQRRRIRRYLFRTAYRPALRKERRSQSAGTPDTVSDEFQRHRRFRHMAALSAEAVGNASCGNIPSGQRLVSVRPAEMRNLRLCCQRQTRRQPALSLLQRTLQSAHLQRAFHQRPAGRDGVYRHK